MTNKELAAQCLIEAAELLKESAGRNGAFYREYATEKLSRLKNGETDGYDGLSDFSHGGREQRIKDLEKEARTGKYYRYGKPELKGKEYLNERSDRQDNAKLNDRKVYLNNYNSKNPDLHRAINRNADEAKSKQALKDMSYKYERLMRKSKNESVDIDSLLEEAMDLLDY